MTHSTDRGHRGPEIGKDIFVEVEVEEANCLFFVFHLNKINLAFCATHSRLHLRRSRSLSPKPPRWKRPYFKKKTLGFGIWALNGFKA